MPVILTPALALRYLRQLSTDLRGALALSADGTVLAGDAALAAPARELAALLPDPGELVVRVGADAAGERFRGRSDATSRSRGTALVARSGGGERSVVLVLAVGPLAPLELLRHDLAVALGGVGGELPLLPQTLLSPGDAVLRRAASSGVQAPEGDEFAVQTAIFAGMGLFDAVAGTSPGRGE